jgi:hypothetical protein
MPLEKFLKSRSAKIDAMALKDTPGELKVSGIPRF